MNPVTLKNGDILQARRVPGFDYKLVSHTVRVTVSGWAEFHYAAGFGDSTKEMQFEHRFPEEEIRRITALLERLLPPPMTNFVIDDSPTQILLYRRAGLEQRIEIYENASEQNYPDRPRFNELWELIHLPLKEKCRTSRSTLSL
jgi:hypothetical protein